MQEFLRQLWCPILGQGATVTKLGVKVTKESVESLTREGVEKALKEAVEKAGTRVLKSANPQKVINALKGFTEMVEFFRTQNTLNFVLR